MVYPNRIAFVGPIGSGKSACSLSYVLSSGQRMSFASTLRQEVAAAIAFRPLLQWWGQYRRNTEGDDYWVQKLMDRIDSKPPNLILTVDDCRYFNEYDALRERGFWFIRLADGWSPTSTEDQQNAILKAPAGKVPGSEVEHPYFECDYHLPWADSVSKRIDSLKRILSSE